MSFHKKTFIAFISLVIIITAIIPSASVLAYDSYTRPSQEYSTEAAYSEKPTYEADGQYEDFATEAVLKEPIDWSQINWDEEIVLLSDLDEFYDEFEKELVVKDSKGLETLQPITRKMSDEKTLEYYKVPIEIKEVVEKYRDNQGEFSNSKMSASEKQLILENSIQSIQKLPQAEEETSIEESEKIQEIDLKLSQQTIPSTLIKAAPSLAKPTTQIEEIFSSSSPADLKRTTLKGLIDPEQETSSGVPKNAPPNEEKLIEFYSGIHENTLDAALYYLSQNQNDDGSFGTSNIYETSAEIAFMLSDIRRTNNNQYSALINFLVNTAPENTREKALKARILIALGQPYQTLLDEILATKNTDHGYGYKSGYVSDVLTTLEVALAYYAGNYSMQQELPRALLYVIHRIRADGQMKYTADANGSYYLINRTAQYLKVFENYNLTDGQTIVRVRDSIDKLLSYLDSHYDAENIKITGADNMIDEIMTVGTWEMYNENAEEADALREALRVKQFYDGNFDQSFKATRYAFEIFDQPDLDLSQLASVGTLVNQSPATFSVVVKNKGYKTANEGKIYVFMDDYNTEYSVDLAENNIVLRPKELLILNITLPNTLSSLADTKVEFYLENPNDFKYEDNWVTGNFNFSAAANGSPALPLYYIAHKHQKGTTRPQLNIRWPNQEDPNRSFYVVMLREKGSSQWLYYGLDNSYSGAFLSGFVEGQTYEINAGVVHRDGLTVTAFSNVTEVTMSANSENYVGSIAGYVTDNNGKLGNVKIQGHDIPANIDETGTFHHDGLDNGTNMMRLASPQYEPIITKFPVEIDQTTENIRIFTRLKPDALSPTATRVEIRPAENNLVPNQTEVNLIAWGTDDVALKKADFFFWDPAEDFWQYLGAGNFDGQTQATLPWYVPETLEGAGYKVKAIVWDFQENYSTAVESAPFTITNGAPPKFTVESPNGGEQWELGSVQKIIWNTVSPNPVNTVDIHLIYSNGYKDVVNNVANTGLYQWQVPNSSEYLGSEIKIKISGRDIANDIYNEDLSDNYFSIIENGEEPEAPWGHPEKVSNFGSTSPLGALNTENGSAIAYDSAGNLHMIYLFRHDRPGTPRLITQRIYYRIRSAAGVWSTPQIIAENITQTNATLTDYREMRNFDMQIGANNKISVVFQQNGTNPNCSGDNEFEIYRVDRNGTTWSQPVNISSNSTYSFRPDLAVNGSKIYTVWLDKDACVGAAQKIFYREDGGTSPISQQINGPQYPGWPEIEATNDGKAHIVYPDEDRGFMGYIYKNGGAWSAVQNISTLLGDDVDVATGINNTLHVAYSYINRNVTPVHSQVIYVFYDGTAWQSPSTASPVVSSGYESDKPQITADADNNPHIIFEHYSSPDKFLEWTTLANSGNWTNPQMISLSNQWVINDTPNFASFGNQLSAIWNTYYSAKIEIFFNTALFDPSEPPPDTAPAKVANFQATPGQEKITLSWDEYTDADGDFDHFNIYRTTDPDAQIADLTATYQIDDISITSYEDTGVEVDIPYYYAITSVDAAGNEDKTVTLAGPITATLIPLPIVNNVRTVSGFSQIVITWDKYSGEAAFGRYRIYRNTSPAGTSQTSELIHESTNVDTQSYTDLSMEMGKKYYYAVTVSDTADAENTAVPFVGPAIAVTPGLPPGITVVPGENDITLSWDPYTDAASFRQYNVYRSASPDANIVDADLIGTISDMATHSYADTAVEPFLAYYYAVTMTDNTGNENGNVSFVGPGYLLLDGQTWDTFNNFNVSVQDLIIQLDWRKYEEDDFLNFNIYRSSSASPSFENAELIAQPNNRDQQGYLDFQIEPDIQYYYVVTVTKTDGSENRNHEFVGPISVSAEEYTSNLLGNISASVVEGEIRISWDAYNGDGSFVQYNVHRSQDQQATIFTAELVAKIPDISTNFYIDTGAELGTEYFYTVTAYLNGQPENIYSGFVGPVVK